MSEEKAKPLLIGYGNTLRGDDGLGAYVVGEIAKCYKDQVETCIVPQLMPEVAALIAQYALVVFVDAALANEKGGCQLLHLDRNRSAKWDTHLSSPEALLALADDLYHVQPEAWCLVVAGTNFCLGEKLSGMAQENAEQAIQMFGNLLSTYASFVTPVIPLKR